MKIVAVLLGLFLSASAVQYSLHGGYKTSLKYVYRYEGKMRPAQVPLLKDQFIELNFNATVEIHPLSNEKFVLKIPKHSFHATLSDPKYVDGPVECHERLGELEALEEYIKLPIVFKYSKGIIKTVLKHDDDKTFSVNLKKGLISLFNVDIQGKDPETGRDDLFTKPEASVIGICSTSYSILDFNVTDARKKLTRMGYNITKVIDMNSCSVSDYEVYNQVVPGPNDNKNTNPLQSSATIKYNILGEKGNFKIEEVHAVGMHVLYLVAKEEGGINSVTDQRLTLVKTEKKSLSPKDINEIEKECKQDKLIMNVRSFGNLEYRPELSDRDESNIADFVHASLVKLLQLLPKPDLMKTRDTSKNLPKVSDILLKIVDAVRKGDDDSTHPKIWNKCAKEPRMKKWTVYIFSLCDTQDCMEFMEKTLKTLPEEELIADYLLSVGFNGKPSRKMADKYLKDIVDINKIKKSPYLTKLAYLAASNMIKTFCKQKKIKKLTWFDKVMIKALSKIPVKCRNQKDLCIPEDNLNLPATVVLALAENVERPVLFSRLEKIVLTEGLPVEIRVKALLAIRPLVRIIPNRVHVTMLRVFRDRNYDTELRQVAFTVIMDNPSPQVILHIARIMHREPSMNVRRFVYDKFVTIRHTQLGVSPKIVSAVKIALQLYSKSMIPSRLLSRSNCFHLNWFSKNWTVGASLKHEEIYKTNFLPNLISSHLNVTIFGRNISVLEAQLRVEGLQDYLSKLIGPTGYWEKKHSIFDFLRSKRSVKSVSKTIEDIQKMIPTFTVPENKFKIFSQLKMFGKIFHVNETTFDSNVDLKNLFLTGSIFRAAALESELKKGTTYEFSKPFMPVEVIYRMPSLIGVTMTANLTSVVVPVSVTKFKAEVKPGLFTPKSLISKQRDSVHVSAEHKLSAIADIRGQIDFRLPSLIVGGKVRTYVNVSTHVKVNVDYDFKTRLFKTEIETPKQIKEIILVKRNASHFLTSEHGGKKSRPSHDKSDSSHDRLDSTHDKSDSSHSKSRPSHDKSDSSHDKSDSTHDKSDSSHSKSRPSHDKSDSSHDKSDPSHDKSDPSHVKPKVVNLKFSGGFIPASEWSEFKKGGSHDEKDVDDDGGDDEKDHASSSEEDYENSKKVQRRPYSVEMGKTWEKKGRKYEKSGSKNDALGRKYEEIGMGIGYVWGAGSDKASESPGDRSGKKYESMGMAYGTSSLEGEHSKNTGRFKRSTDLKKTKEDRNVPQLKGLKPTFSTVEASTTSTPKLEAPFRSSTIRTGHSTATTTKSASGTASTTGILHKGSPTSSYSSGSATTITTDHNGASTRSFTPGPDTSSPSKTSLINPDASMTRPTGPRSTPTVPDRKNPTSGSSGPRHTKTYEIPIEIDQLGKIEVFGMKRRPDVNEDWVLKANGKFISVQGGKVVLSGTPTIWNVTFHGKDRRIVTLNTPDKTFIATSPTTPCLTTSKNPKHDQKLFVLTKSGPNTIVLRSVVTLKSVPKEWGIAKGSELEKIKDIERIFRKEMVELDNDRLIMEEKLKPRLQKARLAHWVIKDNSICLSPFEKKSVRIFTQRKNSLIKILRKQSFKQGICMGSAFGLKTCLHGYRPYPRLNHLPLVFSPMEYHLLLKPSPKIQNLKLSLKLPQLNAKSQTYVATLSIDPSKKVTLTTTYDYTTGTASVEIVPSDVKMTVFPKMCMKLALRPDNLSFTVSFDKGCRHKNLKVDILTSKNLPRFWLALRMKYSSRHIPEYILNALEQISTNVIIPSLKSTVYVYPRPNANKKYEKMAKLKIELPTNETMRVTLKTQNLTYMMNDIKLPRILETLPKGSRQISLLKKLSTSLVTPRCLHINNTFVTFDKKPYKFSLRGQCEHQLLRMCDKNSTNIAVLVRKVDKDMRRIVTVLVDSSKIEIKPSATLHRKPTVVLNGRPLTFKQKHEVLSATKKPLITIIWESETKTLITIHHKYDLQVNLKESYIVSLRVSPFFTNKTCGLCGNSDGEKYNDFMTPEGTIVNDVRKPTLFYPRIMDSAERIFASSWVTPGKACDKVCPFRRIFLKLKPKEVKGKTCLTNYRISQCAPKCKESTKSGTTHIPMTCVPESVIPQLKKYLTNGGKMDFGQAEEFLAEVSIPTECKCSC